MMDLALTLPPAVVELNRFTFQDKNRPAITCVRVEPAPEGQLLAVATDGHRLGWVRWLARDTDVLDAPIHLGGAALAECIKATPTARRLDGVKVTLKGSETCPHFEVETQATDRRKVVVDAGNYDPDHVFPDWRHVVPTAGEKKEVADTWIVNVDYVADLRDYLKASGFSRAIPIQLQHQPADEHSPLFLGVPGGELIDYARTPWEYIEISHILMPMATQNLKRPADKVLQHHLSMRESQ